MRKYTETAKLLFKTQLAYRFDIMISMIFTVSKVLLAYVLWGAVFGDKHTIAGFTFASMLSYYIINSFLSQLDQSSGTGWQISSEIKNGRFSKYIIRPMGIFRYFAAQTVGVSAFLLIFNLVAAAVWVFLFRIDFTFTSHVFNIVSAFILILLGLLFMMQLNWYVGILAFRFLDTSVFMMIKDNIVQFVTGGLIPLTLLPAGIVKAMMLLPFYYVSYLPTMLLLGRNSDEAVLGILVLSCWNIGFAILTTTTFKRLRLKYDGVGI